MKKREKDNEARVAENVDPDAYLVYRQAALERKKLMCTISLNDS